MCDRELHPQTKGAGAGPADSSKHLPNDTNDRNFTALGAGSKAPPAGDLLAQILALAHGYRPGQTDAERRQLGEDAKPLQRQAAVEFGEARGWRLIERRYGPGWILGRRGRAAWSWPGAYWDHPHCYVTAGGRPAAVAAHLYRVPDDVREWATGQGLRAEVIEGSWWFPGWTKLVLYEPGGAGIGGAP